MYPEQRLSPLEATAMQVVWEHNEVTAEDLRMHLAERWPMKESTARTILRRLESKVYVIHTTRARAKDGKYVQEVLAEPWLKSRFVKANRQWMDKWTLHPERSVVNEPPVVVPGLEILPSARVEDWVLPNVGARPADRDPVDARIVKSVRERTGTVPASQADFGWPELAQNRRELTLPDNPGGDDDGDGYTNLEEWLHAFARQVEGR